MGLQKGEILISLRLLEPFSSKCLFLMSIGRSCPTYLINRLLTRILNDISPIKHMLSFFPSSPLMLNLPSRVFGCVVFVHSHNPHCGKLDLITVKCIFIGYLSNKRGLSVIILRVAESLYQWIVVLCQPSTSGERYQEAELVIESLSFPTQDVQVQEVMKPTLVPQQVQLSESKVSIPENSIEDVIDDMSIALRKGERSCVKYHISQFVCTNHLFVQH
ncbi:hypothetical protein CR513_03769, partial [Mucuna pruriens]